MTTPNHHERVMRSAEQLISLFNDQQPDFESHAFIAEFCGRLQALEDAVEAARAEVPR